MRVAMMLLRLELFLIMAREGRRGYCHDKAYVAARFGGKPGDGHSIVLPLRRGVRLGEGGEPGRQLTCEGREVLRRQLEILLLQHDTLSWLTRNDPAFPDPLAQIFQRTTQHR